TIATYGETLHTFVDRSQYKGAFMPGYASRDMGDDSEMLFGIDHVVGNVEHMDEWVSYYERVFGMREMIHFSDQDISTEYSALMSKVVADGRGVEVPDQRAGDRQTEVADRGVPRVLRGPGRAAHRSLDARHRRHRRADA